MLDFLAKGGTDQGMAQKECKKEIYLRKRLCNHQWYEANLTIAANVQSGLQGTLSLKENQYQ